MTSEDSENTSTDVQDNQNTALDTEKVEGTVFSDGEVSVVPESLNTTPLITIFAQPSHTPEEQRKKDGQAVRDVVRGWMVQFNNVHLDRLSPLQMNQIADFLSSKDLLQHSVRQERECWEGEAAVLPKR